MILGTCTYSKQLSDELRAGHWPDGCEPELRRHVESCRECSDVVLLTQAFREARAQSEGGPEFQAPGLVWWKAQIRRRNASAEQAVRPIAVAQAFAFWLSLLFAAVFVVLEYRHGLRWSSWFSQILLRLFHDFSTTSANWNVWMLIPAFASLAVLSGLLVYIVAEKS